MLNKTKIRYLSLADKVYSLLLSQLINGQKKAGERLTEENLSKEFGVSKIPVRDALNRLVKEGFIDLIPRCGRYVRRLNSKDVKDIFEIRRVLEKMALKLGFMNIKDAEIQKLKKLLDKCRNLNGEKKHMLSIEADDKLHNLISCSSGNKYLEQIITDLGNLSRPFRALRATKDTQVNALNRQRKAILDAIFKKNLKEAEKLLDEHIREGKINILVRFNDKVENSKNK